MSWYLEHAAHKCGCAPQFATQARMSKKMTLAQHTLLPMQGTQTDFKNELLYSTFGINYNSLPERFRKVRALAAPQKPSSSLVTDLLPHACHTGALRVRDSCAVRGAQCHAGLDHHQAEEGQGVPRQPCGRARSRCTASAARGHHQGHLLADSPSCAGMRSVPLSVSMQSLSLVGILLGLYKRSGNATLAVRLLCPLTALASLHKQRGHTHCYTPSVNACHSVSRSMTMKAAVAPAQAGAALALRKRMCAHQAHAL